MNKVKKPNLFIVGTHKAGTTALRYLLNQHHSIFFPDKEMHHFESDLHVKNFIERRIITSEYLKKTNIKRESYLENYKTEKDYKIYGDKSPTYLISKTSAVEIFEFNPDAKIIAIFRDPVDYMYSLHSQNLYDMYEDIEDFESALRAETERVKGNKLTKKGKIYDYMLMYKKNTNYVEQLDRYIRLFPQENIRCIIYEDFKNDNEKILREIEDFLSLKKHDNYQFERINTNKTIRYKNLRKIIHSLSYYGIPRKILPDKIFKKLQPYYNEINKNYTRRVDIDENLKRTLKIELKPNVIDFYQYLRRKKIINLNYDLLSRWQGYN